MEELVYNNKKLLHRLKVKADILKKKKTSTIERKQLKLPKAKDLFHKVKRLAEKVKDLADKPWWWVGARRKQAHAKAQLYGAIADRDKKRLTTYVLRAAESFEVSVLLCVAKIPQVVISTDAHAFFSSHLMQL